MAVVAAFELDDLFAAGEGPHQPQHRHAGLGAAVDKAHHLDGGHGLNHHFGQGVFQGAGGAKAGALVDGRMQGRQHLGVGMAADGGAPATDVINKTVAIHVPGVGTLDAVKDQGLAPHRAEGPHR